jgi:hypothetical protein
MQTFWCNALVIAGSRFVRLPLALLILRLKVFSSASLVLFVTSSSAFVRFVGVSLQTRRATLALPVAGKLFRAAVWNCDMLELISGLKTSLKSSHINRNIEADVCLFKQLRDLLSHGGIRPAPDVLTMWKKDESALEMVSFSELVLR